MFRLIRQTASAASPQSSASLRHATGPEDYAAGPMKFHSLVTEEKSDGDYGLYRVEIGPPRRWTCRPLPPRHLRGLPFLDGSILLYDGDRWVDATKGDFLHVPPGGVHGFRNDADEPAQVLILFTPGAPREAYFEGLAHLAGLTDEQRREWNFRHDSYFL